MSDFAFLFFNFDGKGSLVMALSLPEENPLLCLSYKPFKKKCIMEDNIT
jgi:hypothetical protein